MRSKEFEAKKKSLEKCISSLKIVLHLWKTNLEKKIFSVSRFSNTICHNEHAHLFVNKKYTKKMEAMCEETK